MDAANLPGLPLCISDNGRLYWFQVLAVRCQVLQKLAKLCTSFLQDLFQGQDDDIPSVH